MKIIRPATVKDAGTFTSPGGLTYYDKTGTQQIAPANTPRFSYSPTQLNIPPIFMLDSSEVCTLGLVSLLPENEYPAHVLTKAYVDGDRVLNLSNHKIYESVIGVRSATVTITSGVVNWGAPHGLAIGTSIVFESGALPSGIVAGTRYYIITVPAVNTFTVSATIGGTNATAASSGGFVTSVATTNYGIAPTSNSAAGNWIVVGSTNKWAVMDQSVESQTTATDAIMFAMRTPTETLVDSVVLQNVNGVAARVALIDPTDGVVYDKTVSLVSTDGINDPFVFSFEPVVRYTDAVFSGLPPYANAYVSVSIIGYQGETVGCGLCIMGLSKVFGPTQAGMSLGSTDYSVKTTDEWGNTTVEERPYAKTMTMTCFVDRSKMSLLFNLLNKYRSTPIVYVGDESVTASVQYGFYKDYSMGADYPEHSVLHIEIESLT